MFTKLLVPLDRSSLAEQALGRAAAIARESHAALDLVMVHVPIPFAGFTDAPWNEEQYAADDRYLQSVARELATGATVPTTYAVLRGDPVESICDRARDIDADLIVMTSHGRTGLSRAWVGSVADGVVRHAGIPVLMLRPVEGKSERRAAHHLFTQVIVPLDGSATALAVLPAAADLARSSDARLSLVRVVEPVPLVSIDSDMGIMYSAFTQDDVATQHLVDDATQYLAGVAQSVREQHETSVDTHVIVARHVAQGIMDYARGRRADVIAMTTHGRGASRYLIGSIADKLLRASGVPVLLYRPVPVAGMQQAAASNEELVPFMPLPA